MAVQLLSTFVPCIVLPQSILRHPQAVSYTHLGSVSIPKEGNPPTYAVLENGVFSIMDFEGNIVKSIVL